MMGTINCTYETPCGWCAKWDKKCDRKIGNTNFPKEKYGKLIKPCYDCTNNGLGMSECKECNTENGFKYFTKENVK